MVRPDADVLVKLLEKPLGSLCDFELADSVPCNERIKQLLRGIEGWII